jgi:hypothetical protein
MDIKRKTCDIRNWGKKHLFLDISSITNRSLLTVDSATSTPPFQPLRHQQLKGEGEAVHVPK